MGLGSWKHPWPEGDSAPSSLHEDSEKEADRLASLFDRRLPKPPAAIWDAGEAGQSGEGGGDPEWSVARVHWNGVALMLKRDGSGYSDVARMLERLGRSLAEAAGQLDTIRETLQRATAGVEAVLSILGAAGGQFGRNATLGETFDGQEGEWLPPNWLPAGWQWLRSNPRMPDGVDPAPFVTYTLTGEGGVPLGHGVTGLQTFRGAATWAEAVGSVERRAQWVNGRIGERCRLAERRLALFQFRADMVKAVLEEFDALGYVNLVGDRPDVRFAYVLTREEAQVVKGLLDVVEDVPDNRASRDGWLHSAADHLGMKKKDVLKLAIDAGVYVERGGGRRSPKVEVKELEDMIDALLDRLPEAELVLTAPS